MPVSHHIRPITTRLSLICSSNLDHHQQWALTLTFHPLLHIPELLQNLSMSESKQLVELYQSAKYIHKSLSYCSGNDGVPACRNVARCSLISGRRDSVNNALLLSALTDRRWLHFWLLRNIKPEGTILSFVVTRYSWSGRFGESSAMNKQQNWWYQLAAGTPMFTFFMSSADRMARS